MAATAQHSEFQVHLLNEKGIEKAIKLAQIFDTALSAIEDVNPSSSREMSIVRTHLEIASFFAKKAMANQSENQK